MQTIVVGTSIGRSKWLADCLESLRGVPYPIEVVSNQWGEVGKLEHVMKYTNYNEFFLLHDTCIVKDPIIFDMAFSNEASYALSPRFLNFLGKYQREGLEGMDFTHPKTKQEAVLQEIEFNQAYIRDQSYVICPQPLHDTEVFEQRHGRMNMVLENDWIIKYKGTWTWEMAIAMDEHSQY